MEVYIAVASQMRHECHEELGVRTEVDLMETTVSI